MELLDSMVRRFVKSYLNTAGKIPETELAVLQMLLKKLGWKAFPPKKFSDIVTSEGE